MINKYIISGLFLTLIGSVGFFTAGIINNEIVEGENKYEKCTTWYVEVLRIFLASIDEQCVAGAEKLQEGIALWQMVTGVSSLLLIIGIPLILWGCLKSLKH